MNINQTSASNPGAQDSTNSLNRLVAAAVVNRNFRDLLLTEPAQALTCGFQGEVFDLDTQDARMILSIQAESLSDFAQQLADLQNNKQPSRLHSASGCWVPSQCSSVVLDAE
jgi:hypothetical protein